MNAVHACREAVSAVRRLRMLARRLGASPTADAELGRLVAAVEGTAEAVAAQAREQERHELEKRQPRLL